MIHKIVAVGIPCISNEICEIKLNDVARVFGFGKEKVRRVKGPVDLLIGIHRPKLHTRETREAGKLIARNSPFGWVVFGATPEI